MAFLDNWVVIARKSLLGAGGVKFVNHGVLVQFIGVDLLTICGRHEYFHDEAVPSRC